MHVYTSMTSKEELTHHLPVSHPVLDNFVNEFHDIANDLFNIYETLNRNLLNQISEKIKIIGLNELEILSNLQNIL